MVNLILVVSTISVGQNVLTVGNLPNAPVQASQCQSITVGNTVLLADSPSCALDIEILFDLGPNITGIGSVIDTMKTSPFSLTLDSIGVYSFVCLSNNKAIADQCYNVLPIPIPTLGEWALIMLSLLLLIIATIAIKSYRVNQG